MSTAIALTGCSSTDTKESSSAKTSSTTITTTTTMPERPERPAGPAADLSQEITGTKAPFMGAATPTKVKESGYVEQEFVAAGTATSYVAAEPLPNDGVWSFAPGDSAPYRTRVLVRRPADSADFSGTVVVEWLNVSGGIDANPDYSSLEEELLREGHIWVGVSAQLIGVSGGPVLVTAPGAAQFAGKGLKGIDPERYGSLEHPGDGYSFDIFTQVARAVAEGGVPLGGMTPEHVIAAGESQSAIALTNYHNGVQPLTRMFDGFFIHSRAAFSLPLVGPGQYADMAASAGRAAALLRSDLDVPVMELQSESDVTGVLSSALVRQPDTDLFRLWEVAGTAHADAHLLGPIAPIANCGAPINDAPFHIVAKAAFHGLVVWVESGEAPPEAPRIELSEGATPEVQRDEDGIALGGIRTPPVDVPLDVLSGVPGPNTDLFCLLLGTTTPLSAERIADLYPSTDYYKREFKASMKKATGEGFVLEDDHEALLEYSDPDRVDA